jgi:hypothetical protein
MSKVMMLKLSMTQSQREYLEFLVNRRLGDINMIAHRPRYNPAAYNDEIEALNELKFQLKNATAARH